MSMQERFNRSVVNIIERMSHPFFIVIRDPKVLCTCVTDTTSQPDPSCKRCLGTGRKIKIRDIEGAWQHTSTPPSMRPNFDILMARNYYVKPSEWEMPGKDDLIVDEDQIFYVYQNWEGRAFNGELVYNKIMAVEKKMNTQVFLKNFHAIIGR